MRLKAILTVVLLGAALLTGVATARTAAVPNNTSPPTITGTAREGNTLTAHNGSWANAPTSFTYQWQRCGRRRPHGSRPGHREKRRRPVDRKLGAD